jgi:hypothetical protein
MTKRLPKERIEPGLVFGIPLKNGTYTIGQVLDRPMASLASIVLFEGEVAATDLEYVAPARCLRILGTATTGNIALRDFSWPIIRFGDPLALPQERWPNEAARSRNWVGLVVHNTVIIEDFVNACVGFYRWRSYTASPDYFDNMLFPGVPRPAKADLS